MRTVTYTNEYKDEFRINTDSITIAKYGYPAQTYYLTQADLEGILLDLQEVSEMGVFE